jgi:hypothetical protein
MTAIALYDELIEGCLASAERVFADPQLRCTGIHAAREALDRAHAGLKELERETLLLPTNDRQAGQHRFEQLRSRATRAEESLSAESKRLELLGDARSAHHAASIDYALLQTVRLGEESVALGKRALTDLRKQKDVLTAAHQKVDTISTSVESTHKLVGNMQNVQRSNNAMKWAAVALMVLAIGLVAYLKFL